MKKTAILIGLILISSACSSRLWLAKLYVLKAEGALTQAAKMKEKKVSFEERKKLYAKACDFYGKAFEQDSSVFTLNRIEEAADSCWKSENSEQEEIFKAFEEEYAKKHPTEYEFGDAGVTMDMGG